MYAHPRHKEHFAAPAALGYSVILVFNILKYSSFYYAWSEWGRMIRVDMISE
jgi:hypothetical protein